MDCMEYTEKLYSKLSPNNESLDFYLKQNTQRLYTGIYW